ncbi:hypothetical protein C3B55_00637 [Candidatus Pseudomonas adelgestsugas]|uniref:Uncharacterized protein n=1 Tax=Candidatus Pseudomonas adelgestsugas TaxID=1302376 RepID=A0ABX5R8W7_9PSED|nr:hypothetical protein C3B55_00637 [Candidatus Pseudomonas adelgestsugas]
MLGCELLLVPLFAIIANQDFNDFVSMSDNIVVLRSVIISSNYELMASFVCTTIQKITDTVSSIERLTILTFIAKVGVNQFFMLALADLHGLRKNEVVGWYLSCEQVCR